MEAFHIILPLYLVNSFHHKLLENLVMIFGFWEIVAFPHHTPFLVIYIAYFIHIRGRQSLIFRISKVKVTNIIFGFTFG